MILRRSAAVAFVSICSLWPLTDGAWAQDSTGVHIDPGSPTGREYAIPLEKTRRDFNGGQTRKVTPRRVTPARTVPEPPPPPPRFGTGVTAPKHPPKKPVKHRSQVRTTSTPRADTPAAGSPRVPAVKTSSTVSPTAITAGIVAAVLALALTVAVALRLRRRRQA